MLFSQGEANNWYFGLNAGLSFSTTPPSPLSGGQISTLEGCASISDATGALLFYTDGRTVWDRNGQIMPNANYNAGNGLLGDPSSTSSGLIVPQPNTPNRYIIFAVDEPHHENAATYPNQNTGFSSDEDDGFNNGFTYSIVDMTLNGGLGDVIPGSKNLPLITYDTTNPQESAYKCSEKITAVKSDDCNTFWVITHFIDTFYAFRVDQTGVNPTPVTSTVGVTVPISGYRRNALGYIKSSPEGDKLGVVHFGIATQTGENGPGKVALYDFDNTTGIVSNEVELYDGDGPYGIEFSQSGNRMYTTVGIGENGAGDSFILQFDLTLPDNQIASSGTRLIDENGANFSSFSAGALQLGPDGKIYRAQYNFNTGLGNYLGVIENPEAIAANVDYNLRGILLSGAGGGSRLGLPPFIQSIFATTVDIINNGEPNNVNLNLCEGDTYNLSYQNTPGATYTWFVDDIQVANNTNSFLISNSGNYRLEIDLNDGSCPLIGVANVTFFEVPVVENTPANETICDTDNNDSVTLDLSVYDDIIRGAQNPQDFNVRYFRSIADANNQTNELFVSFETETNPQNITARIENAGNPNCYNITSFEIEIFDTPTAFEVDPIIQCDNADDGDDTNGSITYDLTTLNTTIYNGQDPSTFSISYHNSLNGAENGTDTILDPTNGILSNTATSIFARIENNLSASCFDVVEIPVTINLLPEANSTTLTQCDAYLNPNDGISLFNLNEAIDQITGGSANREVLFFEDVLDAQNQSGAITSPQTYQNTQQNQQLFVTVIDENSGCFRIVTLDLDVSTTSANDAILSNCDDDGIEDGFTTFDLSDADAQIVNGLGANLSVAYYETLENALAEVNQITTYTNTTASTQGDDILYARVEDNSNQCFGINQVALYLDPLPTLEEQEDYFLCTNQINIQINAGLLSSENPADYMFFWTHSGETTQTVSVTQAGNYEVSITNIATGCFRERTIEVNSSSPAVIQDIQIQDASTNNSVTIVVEGIGVYEYAIEINNVLSIYQDSPTFTNVPAGFHTVYVRDKNGCPPITTAPISVIGFPGYFSPNGDSFNDTWNIEGLPSELQSSTFIYIFDRYGKLLKQIIPGGNGWDGTFNGRQMPSSEYWYKVQLGDGRLLTGSFSLIR